MSDEVVLLNEVGGAEKLIAGRRDDPVPAPGEALIEQHAIGVNFLDVLQRRGSVPLQRLPAVLGGEAAGTVLAVGEGVSRVKVGDRVAYMGGLGAYARKRTYPADRLIPLPADIDTELVASALLKGLTAHYLLHGLRRLEPGDAVLIHAAAGGVGMILSEWAKRLGLITVGTVSTSQKAETARSSGCDHVVVGYEHDQIIKAVNDATGGRGVALACDSVGQATMAASIAATRQRGTIAFYGSASGAIEPIPLAAHFGRALMFTVPDVSSFNEGNELFANAEALFSVLRQGLRVRLHARVPLSDAAEAHRMMESRRSTGSIVLV